MMVQVCNFFDDVDVVRSNALEQDYRHCNDLAPLPNWVGSRTRQLESNATFGWMDRQICRFLEVDKVRTLYYYHWINEADKECDKWEVKWHTDPESDYAGLVYLHPDPPANTGTLFDRRDDPSTVHNEYNKMVMYNNGIWHATEDTFGETIENSRLTLNFFVSIL